MDLINILDSKILPVSLNHMNNVSLNHESYQILIDIESAVAQQTKKVQFSFAITIQPATIFYHCQRDI